MTVLGFVCCVCGEGIWDKPGAPGYNLLPKARGDGSTAMVCVPCFDLARKRFAEPRALTIGVDFRSASGGIVLATVAALALVFGFILGHETGRARQRQDEDRLTGNVMRCRREAEMILGRTEWATALAEANAIHTLEVVEALPQVAVRPLDAGALCVRAEHQVPVDFYDFTEDQ